MLSRGVWRSPSYRKLGRRFLWVEAVLLAGCCLFGGFQRRAHAAGTLLLPTSYLLLPTLYFLPCTLQRLLLMREFNFDDSIMSTPDWVRRRGAAEPRLTLTSL